MVLFISLSYIYVSNTDNGFQRISPGHLLIDIFRRAYFICFRTVAPSANLLSIYCAPKATTLTEARPSHRGLSQYSSLLRLAEPYSWISSRKGRLVESIYLWIVNINAPGNEQENFSENKAALNLISPPSLQKKLGKTIR